MATLRSVPEMTRSATSAVRAEASAMAASTSAVDDSGRRGTPSSSSWTSLPFLPSLLLRAVVHLLVEGGGGQRVSFP
jgi:hypothetical protein